jgi:hypothetical protein
MANLAQRQLTFWQKNKLFIIAILISSAVTVAFVIVAYAFGWDWAGFSRKNLWDWLQLLIVPIMLAIGGYWLNQMQKSREEETAQRRRDLEAQMERQRTRLETQMDFLRRVRAMHVTIGYARDLLNAHRSAKTYVEQLQQLMKLRADVEEISEDLKASPDLFRGQQQIDDGLEGIIAYLSEAGNEYKKHYNAVTSDPRATHPTANGDLYDVVKQQNMTWVQEFMEGGKDYKNKYVDHLTKAKGTMRSEIYGALQSLPADASPRR